MFGLEKLGSLGQGANDQQPPVILSKEEIERRRKLAQALMLEGSNTAPVQHWLQGAARLGQALTGAVEDYQAGKADETAQAEGKRLAARTDALVGGLQATPAAPANPLAGVKPMDGGDDLGKAANAITSIESGGRYDALGPATKSGDRAYGRYQVMGANIPSWTQKHIGQQMTPEQFAASPEAQDAVFKGEFGRLSQKYGPEGAARAWFAGEGGMNDMSRKDILGTTVGDYSRKFTSAFAPGSQPAPAAPAGGQAQVAQALTAPPSAAPQRSLPELMAIANSPAFDRMPKGSQDLVKALIQKQVTAETKDPLVQEKLRLEVEDLRKRNSRTEMETFTDPATGRIFQRLKGSNAAPVPVEGLGAKPEEPKFREFNGRLYQEGRDGSLIDKTPQGGSNVYPPMTPDQRRSYNVPEGTPAYMGPDGKPFFGPASRTEQGEFGKAADKKMVEYFGTHAEGGNTANAVLQGMDVLREIGSMAPQGGVSGRLAGMFPGFNTAADVFNSQIKTLAPQLRVPGSGATSDKDLDTFMAALPSLKNTPEANQAILGLVEAKAKLNLQRSEIARRALRREIDSAEADKQLRDLDRQSIFTPEARKALGLGAAKADGQKPGGGPRILSVEPIR